MNRPEQARDSIVRNAAFAVGVKLVGSVFTAVLTMFLVRYLGPAEYGVFALAMSVGGLVLIPSDLGISHSAARFIAELRGKPDDVSAVISGRRSPQAGGQRGVLAGPDRQPPA